MRVWEGAGWRPSRGSRLVGAMEPRTRARAPARALPAKNAGPATRRTDFMWTLIARAVKASGAIEQAVLYLLVAFSVASWALILMKGLSLYRAARNNRHFL